MNDGLVIRLLRVATYMHDIGENGYEVETIKEAAVRIEALLAAAQVANDRVEILEKQNGKLKEMFRVHMLRLMTNLTHEDIDNHIEEVLLND